MKTASRQSRRTLVAFGSAILTLLVVGVVAYRNAIVSNESNKWGRHTHEVLDTLQDLRFAMESIQSNTRGFVLTGKDSYLASYRDSASNAERGEASIRKLTADNPEQQRLLAALKAQVAQKVQHAELVIDLRRTKGFEAATDEVGSGLGQQIMDQFQGTIGALRNEELRLLVLRDADTNQHLHETNMFLILGTVLGLLIAGAAGRSVLHDISVRKAAEKHLGQMESRYRGLLEAAPDAMVVVNQGGEIVLLNVQAEKRFGYRRDELLGQKVKNIIPEGFAERLIADGTRTEADALAQQIGAGIELSGRRKDGSEFPIEIMLSPLESTEGILVTAAIRDISVRKQAEVQLLEAAMRLRTVAATAVDGLILIDLDGSILMFNRACERLFGYGAEEVIGKNVKCLMPSPYHEEHDGYLDSYHQTGARKIIGIGREVVGRRKDGTTFPMGLSVGEAMENGRTVYVGNIHDLTERVRGEQTIREVTTAVQAMKREMAHSAEHDLLTGLPNRMLLNDRLSQAIVSARRHKNKVVVLFLDLDGFKHINDSLGHCIGDKLLQSIATRLVLCVRGTDTVGRQGGDEFVVLLTEVEQSKDAAITARRILATVAEAHSINQDDLRVTASIGLSVYPDDGLDAETLIKNADAAMAYAKEKGRQSYQFFEPAMNIRAVERQSIEACLRTALERQEFSLHYQPKVNLRTGKITGAEALIRWTHPTRGQVAPAQFIPVAEDCGLILPISDWVLREACRQARAWIDAGLLLGTMAVNISAIEFRDENFLKRVFAVLSDTGLDPRSLELELTESVLMKHAESTDIILKSLRASGVRLAIDDFGTGYSSLSYLKKFPINTLKIDQSFIRQITATPDETSIVSAVIAMGRSLKLLVVAEGVETEDEMVFLQANKCEEAQGYYFSKPLPPQQFASLLETGISDSIFLPSSERPSTH